jgi:hypothetical protein
MITLEISLLTDAIGLNVNGSVFGELESEANEEELENIFILIT